jgi:hypothetical protein
MSAKTVKIDDGTDAIIKQGADGTGLSKKAILDKAVRYYVPRLLRGEISIIERDEQKELAFPHEHVGAGGAR